MNNNIVEFYQDGNENIIITWIVDHACNYICEYCSTHYKKNQIDKDYIQFLGFLKEVRNKYPEKNIVLFLSGGEVTIWNQLEEFLSECQSFENLYLNIITNGHRSIKWWNKIKDLIHFIDISFHPDQANEKHITELLKLLKGKCELQLLMLPEKFDNLLAMGKRISKNSKTPVILKYVRRYFSKELYEYTEDQLKIIKEVKWFGIEYPRVEPIPGQKEFCFKYENGEVKSYNSLAVIFLNELNHWKGWNCWGGISSFFIDNCDDIFVAICKNDIIGNLQTGFFLPDEPTICEKNVCLCLTDMLSRKVKNE